MRALVGALEEVARPLARRRRPQRPVELLKQRKRDAHVEPPLRGLRVRILVPPVLGPIERRMHADP
eukprot:123484-Prymnesium_polylepis.1